MVLQSVVLFAVHKCVIGAPLKPQRCMHRVGAATAQTTVSPITSHP